MGARFGKNGEKTIHCPELSPQLAELAGIILGDGGISQYQLKSGNKSEYRSGLKHHLNSPRRAFGDYWIQMVVSSLTITPTTENYIRILV